MTARERNIVELAFGNLEKTISLLPRKVVSWRPPLTRSEVAKLRRRLVWEGRP